MPDRGLQTDSVAREPAYGGIAQRRLDFVEIWSASSKSLGGRGSCRTSPISRASSSATPMRTSRRSRAEGETKWLSFVTGYLRPAEKHGAVELWIDRLMPRRR